MILKRIQQAKRDRQKKQAKRNESLLRYTPYKPNEIGVETRRKK